MIVSPTPSKEANRGYAMILVLWAMMLLSLIAASLLTQGRMSARIENNAFERLERDLAMEAALNRAVLELFDTQAPTGRFVGREQNFVFQGYEMTFAISEEIGKIDLNAAPESLLRALLRSEGVGPSKAEAIRKIARTFNDTSDRLLFDANECGPSDDLRYEFEAINDFDPKSKETERELILALIHKHHSKIINQRSK